MAGGHVIPAGAEANSIREASMGQKVLYREWRPKTFDEVVGQTHIVNALRQAVKTGELAHAYLFVGTRGTGKTSLAKIFARAVNCLHPTPDGNPCNECEICRGILDGSLLDVIEMDAASHNSVDNIRKITDEVLFLPTLAKYKVYIIDEVHMLSVQAFNALLKTLEEPPAHVIFIMATTDPQRILPTILSRCQRYDFKRIPPAAMQERLALIARENNIPIDEEGLRTIVSRSEGALRDAISLLDQSRTVFSGKIGREEILSMTGVINDELLEEIVLALVRGDADRLLLSIDHLIMEGGDLQRFTVSLLSYFRDILVCKTSRQPERLLQLPQRTMQTLKSLAPRYSQETLIRQISHLTRLQQEMKTAANPRITLEVGLIRMLDQMKIRRLDASEAAVREAQASVSEKEEADAAAPEDRSEDPGELPPEEEAGEETTEDFPDEAAFSEALEEFAGQEAAQKKEAAEADESDEEDDDDAYASSYQEEEDSEEYAGSGAEDEAREEEDGRERSAALEEVSLEDKLDALEEMLDLSPGSPDSKTDSAEAAESAAAAKDLPSPAPEADREDAEPEAAEAEDAAGDFDGLILDFSAETGSSERASEKASGKASEKKQAPAHEEAAEEKKAAAGEEELPEGFDPLRIWQDFIGRLTEQEPLLGILLNSYPHQFAGRTFSVEVPAERKAIYDKIKSRKNQTLLEQVFARVKPAGEWHLSVSLEGGEKDASDKGDPLEPAWIKKMRRAAKELDIPFNKED